MPWAERDRDLAWQPLQDGDQVATGQGDLLVIHTPGHAPDHVCLWHEASRTLFVGDMLVQGTTVMIPASHGGSLVDYLRSLDRLLALNAARALPAHGPPIDDPAALIRHYIEHRAQREAQVQAALEAGARTIDELLARIYPGLQPALEPMARESLLAHLVKLASDGRAEPREGSWTVR
jgi:ribonuclease/clavin/mitogillin